MTIAAEYQKPFFRGFDTRFFLILVGALLLETVSVLILARQPVEEYSDKEIARLQERFANFVLGEPGRIDATPEAQGAGQGAGGGTGEEAAETPEAETPAETPESGGGETRTQADAAQRQAARAATATAQREAMTREVSNKGLLRMLTGTGSAAQGSAVSDLLASTGRGQGNSGANLDALLSSAGGLKTSGTSGLSGNGSGGTGGAARGGRSGGKAGIDDLVSDLGGAQSQSLERKGELAVETPADVVGRGQASVNRSPQEIQRVIMGHLSAVQYCYERELKRSPDLKGKVTVRITVNADGHVSEVTIVNSTLNNERVERCILARIGLWKDFKPIDPSDGDVTFRQSFTFGY